MAQTMPRESAAAEQLAALASAGRFAFIVFYKANDAATQSMAQVVQQGMAARPDRATALFVNAADPSEKGLVDRFGLARAPLPMTVAVAPNGAVTGLFRGAMNDAHIERAIVSPTMAECMKSIQAGRFVLACVQTTRDAAVPQGVTDFKADPEFHDRVDIVSLNAADPAEARLLSQFQVDAKAIRAPLVAFIAPPAVLVGKFPTTATAAELAAALHKAGKCCDDPNCKHAQPAPQANQPNPQSRVR